MSDKTMKKIVPVSQVEFDDRNLKIHRPTSLSAQAHNSEIVVLTFGFRSPFAEVDKVHNLTFALSLRGVEQLSDQLNHAVQQCLEKDEEEDQ